MYVLIHKNHVRVGPMDWNYAMFNSEKERIGINKPIPTTVSAEDFPYILDSDTKICEVNIVVPPHNEITHSTYGPEWNFEGDVAVATYPVKERPIGSIQEILIRRAADWRYFKENEGVDFEIQNKTIRLDTTRDKRYIYLNKYLTMSENDVVDWKFDNGEWLTLTKTEVFSLAAAIETHIQTVFSAEKQKTETILATTTVDELSSIVIEE